MQNKIESSDLLEDENFLRYLDTIFKFVREYKKLKSELDFNIFSLVTERYHLENLHSDIIYKLLDPDGGHNEKNKFLNYFLEGLLKMKPHFFEKEDFKNARVEREKDRIDITIKDDVKKYAIIIENKINGAIDQDRQIEGYIKALEGTYTIKAIVYINLYNNKKPDTYKWEPKYIQILEEKLILLPAYNSTNFNLVRLWIEKCAEDSCTSSNNSQIFHQYKNLIIKIADSMGNIKANEKMYEKFTEDGSNLLKKSTDLYFSMQTFRNYLALKIHEKYEDFEHKDWCVTIPNLKLGGTRIVCDVNVNLTEKGVFLYKFRIYPFEFEIEKMLKIKELDNNFELKDRELSIYFNFPEHEQKLYDFLGQILEIIKN